MKRFKALVLSVCLIFLVSPAAQAATLGPATSYAQLLELADAAGSGDVILVSGELSAKGQPPLSTQAFLHITSSAGTTATLLGMQLLNASVAFSSIDLADSLAITGTSHVELSGGVTVRGADGQSAVSFDGNGSLLLYPGSTVKGGKNGEGVVIRHRGGDFYAGIEGTIHGGSGHTGGSGLTVSPLTDTGTLMISGSIHGGSGTAMGGHALNLYDLSGNAFITVAGSIQGGDGPVGGDGIQLVATRDNVNVGIQGTVSGGCGEDFGGDALILMNIGGASSVSLAGSLTGGDVTLSGAQPGVSLLVVGDSTSAHTHLGNCILQDGRDLAAFYATPAPTSTPEPSVTPLPEITSSVEDTAVLATPTPEHAAAPTETPAVQPTAAPTKTPAPQTTPTAAPTAEPTATPTVEPTDVPTEEPSIAPSAEPTASPAIDPTAAPTAEPTPEPTTEPTTEPTAEPTAVPTPETTTAPIEHPSPEATAESSV